MPGDGGGERRERDGGRVGGGERRHGEGRMERSDEVGLTVGREGVRGCERTLAVVEKGHVQKMVVVFLASSTCNSGAAW